MGFVVAIDGPAGSGKGTIAKLVSEKLGFLTIDTGAMYRCVTLYFLNNNIDIENKAQVKNAMKNINIDMRQLGDTQEIFLNGENVSSQIRTKEVDGFVSPVSALAEVREVMVNLQRKLSEGKNIVMEGRDIGTNVFPNAEVKIYLDATPEERARRRLEQNKQKGIDNISYEEVLESIKNRDYIDSTRTITPLKKADDAVLVDSSNMTISEVVDRVISIIESKRK